MGGIFFVVLFSGGMFFLVWYLNNKKKTELMSKGQIVDRGNNFYKQAHTFTTRTGDFSAIARAIDHYVLGENKITFEPYIEQGQIVFNNRVNFGSFRARLKTLGHQDGQYYYQFQVETWSEGQYGMTRQDLFGANILLTAIEKAFLRIDPETGADRMAATYKTKTRLF